MVAQLNRAPSPPLLGWPPHRQGRAWGCDIRDITIETHHHQSFMGRDCPSPRRPVREVLLQNIQIITLAVMRALSLRIYDAGAGADEAYEALHSRVRASNRF